MTLPTATKALRQVFEGLAWVSQTCRNHTSYAHRTGADDDDRQAGRFVDFLKVMFPAVPQTEAPRTIVVGMFIVVEGDTRQD